MFDIVTAGLLLNERIRTGTLEDGPFLGGTVSYATVALGRLGAKVGIVSRLGPDLPAELRALITGCGADTCGLIEGDATMTNLLVYDDSGNKQLIYLRKVPEIAASDIPERYFHTKIFFACPVDYDLSADALGEIKGRGLVTAADFGGLGGAHVSAEKRAQVKGDPRYALAEYGDSVDIAKASLEDCVWLFGDSDIAPEQAAARFLGVGCSLVVLTLGERGALIVTGDKTLTIPALPVCAMDTTGAGDTFMAAFLYAYVRTDDMGYAGQFATAASALLIERTGGISFERVPDLKAVLEKMEQFGEAHRGASRDWWSGRAESPI